MILIIRISGDVEIPEKIRKVFYRLCLRKKYSATLLPKTEVSLFIIKKIRNYVAYGTIEQSDLIELIQKRGIPSSKAKIDAKLVAEFIFKKGMKNSGIKPFFRLHPPRKGIDSKLHFPIRKGVLGDNGSKINELLRRML